MIDVSDLSAYMGLSSLTDEQVPVIAEMEQRAVQFVETQTGRHFGATETFVEVVPGSGGRRLWLQEAPASITTVRERLLVDATWSAITAGDDDGYELRDRSVLRKNGYVWSLRYEYEITYDFGYAAGTEPGDVRQLVMDLVKLKWDGRDRSADLVYEQEGAQSRRYERSGDGSGMDGLMSIPWVAETIAAYRRPRLA